MATILHSITVTFFFFNTEVSFWKPSLMLVSPCWTFLVFGLLYFLLYSSLVTSAWGDLDRTRPAWNIISWPFTFCSLKSLEGLLPLQIAFHSVHLPLPPVMAHVSGMRFSLYNKAVRNLEVIWAIPHLQPPLPLMFLPILCIMACRLCLYTLLW